MWKTFVILINISLAFGVFSQTPVQNIRGKVVDEVSGQALVGVYLCLPGTEPLRGTVSDEKGIYRLDEVPVGRYQLEVSYIGYETLLMPEVLVESGRELILNIELTESESTLKEVTIVSAGSRGSSMSPVSIQALTVEESLRFPATFNDPARVAMTYAGVANNNDQANGVTIRGNSPNHLSWRLEGAEIVNPNHLSNAGTFSDRVVKSGGGVNILSSQLLGTSYFYTGAFPSSYGNALGGIMDMHFRQGNDEQTEFTLQAGLIGFEFAAEGPLSKKTGASFLVNYRYSFVGLLTSMGVDFGGESIAFQDLAFNVAIPTKNDGIFKLFGMGGASKNIFEGNRDSTQWELYKDRFDIEFHSKMGAVGGSYAMPVGTKGIWNLTAIASAVDYKRESQRLNESLTLIPAELDSSFNRKISLTSSLTYKLPQRQRLKIGVSAMQELYQQQSLTDTVINNSGEVLGWLLEPYARWTWQPIDPLKINVGLHYAFFTYNRSQSLEPRLSLKYQLDSKNSLSLAYGLHSQLQLPQLYLAIDDGNLVNDGLNFTKAHHLIMAYNLQLNPRLQFKAEVYYQYLFDVPVSTESSSFSGLNVLEGLVNTPLENNGIGQNYGLELTLQRRIAADYFFLLNGSYYESKYKGSDGQLRDTRFNGNYIFNLTAGKEFQWRKKNRQRILGVNFRLAYLGGERYSPIDIDLSRQSSTTIFEDDAAFSLQQQDYFKVDFRIYYKNNKPGFHSILALDLQNATNTKNEAYRYFDVQQSQITTKLQLGLIPNLSYRVEF